MASKTDICNLALTHAGVTKAIGNIETEKSQESNACRQWYDQALNATLSDFKWPFATKFLNLALVASNPTTEWNYAYRYPPDCLFFRRILSGIRTDTHQSRVPFRIAADDLGQLIYTDMATAQSEYTFLQNDTNKFTTNFIDALAARLGAYIAPLLSGGDPFQRQVSCLKIYGMELMKAQENSGNEEQPDLEPESEFIRARGGTGNTYPWPWPGDYPWLP